MTYPALIDRALRGRRWRSPAGVVAGALVVSLAAQIEIALPFTPVPISGQTLGVALTGASLGWRRGGAALALYLALGAAGLPVFAGGEAGAGHLVGPTAGYLFGFMGSACVIGALAERGALRRPLTAFLACEAGSLTIFGLGVTILRGALDMGWGEALQSGWLPFVPGDLLKCTLAALLLSRVERRLPDA